MWDSCLFLQDCRTVYKYVRQFDIFGTVGKYDAYLWVCMYVLIPVLKSETLRAPPLLLI